MNRRTSVFLLARMGQLRIFTASGSWRLTILILVVAIVLEGCAATPETKKDIQPPAFLTNDEKIEEAKEILAGVDDQRIVEYFGLLPIKPPRSELGARDLFVLGRAYFNTARQEIELFRGGENPGMGYLPPRLTDMLLIARNNLLAAADMEPEKVFAPEAFYLAGRSMDHGFLQIFTQAMEMYQWAADAYPSSEFGQKAAERYRGLQDYYGGTKGTSHGE